MGRNLAVRERAQSELLSKFFFCGLRHHHGPDKEQQADRRPHHSMYAKTNWSCGVASIPRAKWTSERKLSAHSHAYTRSSHSEILVPATRSRLSVTYSNAPTELGSRLSTISFHVTILSMTTDLIALIVYGRLPSGRLVVDCNFFIASCPSRPPRRCPGFGYQSASAVLKVIRGPSADM